MINEEDKLLWKKEFDRAIDIDNRSNGEYFFHWVRDIEDILEQIPDKKKVKDIQNFLSELYKKDKDE